jgi:hypothetical protein
MTTEELITALFYEVDDQLRTIPPPPEAHLWPRAGVTWGLVHARQGVGTRPFSRWLTRASRPCLPRLPERTRLLRLLTPPQDWPRAFLAAPTVLGVMATEGSELLHPLRAGRRPQHIGRHGRSHQRWIGGGTLWLRLQPWGGAWGGPAPRPLSPTLPFRGWCGRWRSRGWA